MRGLGTALALVLCAVPAAVGHGTARALPRLAVERRFLETPAGVAAYIGVVAPRVQRAEAQRLARILVRVGQRWKVSPLLLAAIVRHESAFRRNLRVCTTRGCDHGLGQVNDVHVEELDLDVDRLDGDDAYNLNVAAQLLARHQGHAAADPFWWSRYHDGRAKLRRTWETKVLPYLRVATQEISVERTNGKRTHV